MIAQLGAGGLAMNIHNKHEGSQPSKARLPFSALLPFVTGIAAGLLLRFVFSDEAGDPLSAMSGAFVFGAPLIVGAVTVFVAEWLAPHRWGFYASAGALSVLLFVLGTMIVMFEGLICAALISPLFALLGAIGGLIMGAACRLGRHASRVLRGFMLLPLLLLGLESNSELPTRIYEIERAVLIEASPEAVWKQLQHVRDIQPSEVEHAWAFRIGAPLPQSGISTHVDVPVRRVTMGRHVYFDQVVAESRENEYVRWTYRFYEDSFPPHAFDDHVKIGGRHFDIIDTAYTLAAAGTGTRLLIRTRYRLSTRFNWYAGPLVEALMIDVADVYLEMYRTRSAQRRS
jgi:hypothetical protein